jgi:hypothetical protein
MLNIHEILLESIPFDGEFGYLCFQGSTTFAQGLDFMHICALKHMQ